MAEPTLLPPLSDEQFLSAFLSASLSGAEFNHRGHVRAAWLLLQRHPVDMAIDETCSGISRLATRLGAPDKFHRTLTEAFVRLMADAGAGDTTLAWPDFQARNAELLNNAKQVLTRHYTDDRLNTEAARVHFLPPDLAPLPA